VREVKQVDKSTIAVGGSGKQVQEVKREFDTKQIEALLTEGDHEQA
jgi:transcription antitermination factor NusA-like protein